MADDFKTLKESLISSNKNAADKKEREDSLRYDKEDENLKTLISEQKNFKTAVDKDGKKVNKMNTNAAKLQLKTLDNQIQNLQETQLLRQEVNTNRTEASKALGLDREVLKQLKASIEENGKSVELNVGYQEEAKRIRLAEFELKKQDLTGAKLQKVDIEEQKFLLEDMKKGFEEQGLNAAQQKDFQEATLDIQQKELNLKRQGNLSQSAKEELDKEQKTIDEKRGSVLKDIAAGVTGMASALKKSFNKFTGGDGKFGTLVRGSLFAGLLFAIAKFLQSPAFKVMVKSIGEITTKLGKFYDDFFGPEGGIEKGFKSLFDDKDGVGGVVLGITGVVAAIAIYKVATIFNKIKNGVGRIGSFLGSVGGALKNMILPKKKSLIPTTPGVPTKGQGIVKTAGNFAKMGKSAGKGIGGFISGILKGVASGLAAIANPATLLGLAAVVLAVNGIALAIRIMSPAFKPIGKMMKDFGESVREVFGGLGDFVKDIGKTIEGIINSLGKSIGDVVDKISSMSTAGTEATTKQIKELSAIPAKGMFEAAKGIDAMKAALNDFGGGTFSKVAENLFGGGGPIEKIVELTKKVPALMKAAEAISVISAAGGDYAMAQAELKRRKKVAELEKEMAEDTIGLTQSKEGFAKEQAGREAELKALKSQKMELKLSGSRARGGPMSANNMYLVGENGPELVMPKSAGMVQNEQKTDSLIKSAINKSSNGSAPILVNAPNTTNAPTNNSSTNVAASTFVEPDAMFRRNSQYAI